MTSHFINERKKNPLMFKFEILKNPCQNVLKQNVFQIKNSTHFPVCQVKHTNQKESKIKN